ncbi:MAG: TlpA family protein disulfide reductase [Actinomycetota bacterium]
MSDAKQAGRRSQSKRPARKPAPGSSARRARWLALVAGAAIVAIAIGVAMAATNGGGSGGATTRHAATNRTFELLDGDRTTLRAFEGQPVVVNFMASWCVACQAELPRFQALSEKLDGKVAFVGLALQDTPEDARALVARTGVRYPVGLDPDGALFSAFDGRAMPTTVFLDADGRVVERFSGELTAEVLETNVREVLL